MFFEHIVWGLAIAIPVATLLRQDMLGRYTALLVFSGCVPDLDGLIDLVPYLMAWQAGVEPIFLHHRYLHSVGFILLYALLAGLLLCRHGWDRSTSTLVAGIGGMAHLVEDCLVYRPAGAFLWPFSTQMIGIGAFPSYSRDVLWIANSEVLLLGFCMALLTIAGSVTLQRMGWTPRTQEIQPFSWPVILTHIGQGWSVRIREDPSLNDEGNPPKEE